ncbi:hypothetical protein Sjap_005268 [Stephania japonica]|uniref:Uncharacterized protein n=1 Tax=Stephania japonica TaxID=461633 RepID=A0AAP0K660_9MAGN
MDCKLVDNNMKPKEAGHEPDDETITKQQVDQPKALLWDCDSSLYDSFEKNSFERQLNSAIASRSFSMPRLPPTSSIVPPPQPSKKLSSKISRSLNKFLRSVFRPNNTTCVNYGGKEHDVDGPPYSVQDRFGSLSAIPEMQEIGLDCIRWPLDRGSLVRRSASERFSATSIGISCA